jgi:hypothetical protein
MRLPLVLLALALFPTALLADVSRPLTCAEALEQVAALQTLQPVYKLSGGERRFIEDANRPAEITRIQQIVTASCSSNPKLRASEQAEASRLHVALSPECAVERDRLSAMEQKNSHEPRDSLETERKLVATKCPTLDTTDRWLVQWDGRSDLPPLDN